MNSRKLNLIQEQCNFMKPGVEKIKIPTREELMTELMLSHEITYELVPKLMQRTWVSIIKQVNGDDTVVPVPTHGLFSVPPWKDLAINKSKDFEDIFLAQYETVVRSALCAAYRQTCDCTKDEPFNFCVGKDEPRDGEELATTCLHRKYKQVQ